MAPLLLLSALLALGSASATPAAPAPAPLHLRGVPGSLRSLYEAATLLCDGGKVSVPRAQVNDGYCDCADGADEPGTSACANARFYCVNKGYRGKYLPSMYVGDGVCDCW